jgi:hypothetical protein
MMRTLLPVGQLSQIGSEVDRAESGFDLATRVIQMFGEDILIPEWCDLPSCGNSCWNGVIYHLVVTLVDT